MKKSKDSIIKGCEEVQTLPNTPFTKAFRGRSCLPGAVNYMCLLELDALYTHNPHLTPPLIDNLLASTAAIELELCAHWIESGKLAAALVPEVFHTWGDPANLSRTGQFIRILWLEGFLTARIALL